MRTITDHIVPGDTAPQLFIDVVDEPGAGGANHAYVVGNDDHSFPKLEIDFQNGPIKERGVNGVTQEALLAVVIDRLRSFQAGPFSCDANARALSNCEVALKALQQRTVDRIQRGVEGRGVA